MEEKKVGETSVLNKQNIYTKWVLVQPVEVSIRNCHVRLLEGRLSESKISIYEEEVFIIVLVGHHNSIILSKSWWWFIWTKML